MSFIKIFRLKEGDDIISFYEKGKGTLKLIHPVAVYITYTKENADELFMKFWLPSSLIVKNEVEIHPSSILAVMEPKEEMKELYFNFLNGLDITANLNVEDILEGIDAKNTNKIH